MSVSAIAEAFVDPKGSVEDELKRLRLQCSRLVKLNETRLLAENVRLRNQLYWARNMQTAFHNWLHHKSQGEQVSTAECKTRVQWMGNALDGVTPLMAQAVETPPPTPPQTWGGESLLSIEQAEMRVAPWIKRMVKPSPPAPLPKMERGEENEGQQGELSKADSVESSPPTPLQKMERGVEEPQPLPKQGEGSEAKDLTPDPSPNMERGEGSDKPQITIIMPGEKSDFNEPQGWEERAARMKAASNARILAKMQAEFGTPQQPTNIIMIGAGHNDAE